MTNSFLNLHFGKDRPLLNEISQIEFSLLKGLKILVVGTHEDSQLLLQMMFEDYHIQVKTATSASEAIETIKDWKPDILISDIRMKEKDGYWLIRSIREKEASLRRFIFAIAITAYVGEIDDALNAGYQNAILIPFNANQLIGEVAKVRLHEAMSFYLGQSF